MFSNIDLRNVGCILISDCERDDVRPYTNLYLAPQALEAVMHLGVLK